MASLTQSVSMVTVIKFPQRCMYCLSFSVIVLKLCLSSLSFIGTHVSIPSPFLSSVLSTALIPYSVCFCLRPSVVILLFCLCLSPSCRMEAL